MATIAQINANRRNAKKSTGPRSTAGKAASSRNGIPRPPRTSEPLPPDDPAELMQLLQDLFSRFRPDGEYEEVLVLRIGLDQYRLGRVLPLYAAICRDRLRAQAAQHPSDDGYAMSRAFAADCAGPRAFLQLARYETYLGRSIDRLLLRLRELQSARQARQPAATPSKIEENDTNPKNEGTVRTPPAGPFRANSPLRIDHRDTNPNKGGIPAAPSPP